MYLEASLFLAFDEATDVVRIPRPTVGGRLLQVLSLGLVGQTWERERVGAADLLRELAAGVRDAGVTDLVSASIDGVERYRDEIGKDGDLAPVLEQLAADARTAGSDFANLVELVATWGDDVGTYVIQILTRRTHPIDTPPIQVRVYALAAQLDARQVGAGYRGARSVSLAVRDRVIERLFRDKTPRAVLGPLGEGLERLCDRLERGLRARLHTHASDAIVLACMVRPRQTLALELVQPAGGPLDPALFRPHPGFREATYYLRVWGDAMTQARATLRRTLVVDERGRPILHVGDEPLDLSETDALRPGLDLASLQGPLDLAWFAGNDYEDALRAAGCLQPSAEPDPDAAWREVRHRELGVRHTATPNGRVNMAELLVDLDWNVRWDGPDVV